MTRTVFTDDFLRTQNDLTHDLQRTKLAQQRVATQQLYFDTQILEGDGSSQQFAPALQAVLYDGLTQLSLSYTPQVDGYWEVVTHLGYILNSGATADQVVVTSAISPAPPSGTSFSQAVLGLTPGGSGPVHMDHTYMVSAGTAYRCAVTIAANGSGNSLFYDCHPYLMWMHGKAWSRG